MARKPRIEFEGAVYHVIMRGNRREPIFRDSADSLRFLDMMSAYKFRYPFYLYAYALMGNHVHLLVEIRETPLSKILQCLNLRYAKFFNRKYETVGHLFQGRYKAILCDKDRYLLALIRYIHRNPVRAGIADNEGAYPWTSHHAYVGTRPAIANKIPCTRNGLVDTSLIHGIFSDKELESRKQYDEFMTDDISMKHTAKNPQIKMHMDRSGHEKAGAQVLRAAAPRQKRQEFTLDTIASTVEILCGVSRAQLQSRCRDKNVTAASRLFSVVAKEFAYTGIEISKFVHKDPAIITRHVRFKHELSSKMREVIETLSAPQSQLSQT